MSRPDHLPDHPKAGGEPASVLGGDGDARVDLVGHERGVDRGVLRDHPRAEQLDQRHLDGLVAAFRPICIALRSWLVLPPRSRLRTGEVARSTSHTGMRPPPPLGTSRWLMTAASVLASWSRIWPWCSAVNTSTTRSSACGASLVCSDDSTR